MSMVPCETIANTHAWDFLVYKYIDDHHVDEKYEVKCDEKSTQELSLVEVKKRGMQTLVWE